MEVRCCPKQVFRPAVLLSPNVSLVISTNRTFPCLLSCSDKTWNTDTLSLSTHLSSMSSLSPCPSDSPVTLWNAQSSGCNTEWSVSIRGDFSHAPGHRAKEQEIISFSSPSLAPVSVVSFPQVQGLLSNTTKMHTQDLLRKVCRKWPDFRSNTHTSRRDGARSK